MMAKIPTAYVNKEYEIGYPIEFLLKGEEIIPKQWSDSLSGVVFCRFCGWRVFGKKLINDHFYHGRKRHSDKIEKPFCSLDIPVNTKDGRLNENQENKMRKENKVLDIDLGESDNQGQEWRKRNPNPEPRGLPKTVRSVETLAEGLYGYYDHAVKFSDEDTTKVVRKLLRSILDIETSDTNFLWYAQIDYCKEWISKAGKEYLTIYVKNGKDVANFSLLKNVAKSKYISNKKKGRFILGYGSMEDGEFSNKVYLTDKKKVSLVPERNEKYLIQNNDD
jgi:hypothetical protein